ncbi:MAG: hypothetical protein Q8Q47_00990, partial [Ignavibacteriaceae bacterium]|nr:hypothetical protein [Ignavibacteriaceae bacterium]
MKQQKPARKNWVRTFVLAVGIYTSALQAQVISGRVIDGIDGTGVAGVNVKIVTTNPWTNYSVTSGPNGEFSFITDVKDENNNSTNTTIDADVTSISSKPYFTIQNRNEQDANITIYDIRGQKERSINMPITNGINNTQWDAKNDNGQKVGTGIYISLIQIGKTNIPKKFMIINGETEGQPRNNTTTKTNNTTFNKTTEIIDVRLKLTDPQGIYENSIDDFTCEGDTTYNIIARPKKDIENQFPAKGQLIKTFSNITEYILGVDINQHLPSNKPTYPIQINTTTLPTNIKENVTQAMNTIDSLTEKDFTTEGNGNIELFVVNNDTTKPLMTQNIYGEWTENDTTGHPTKGKIYINTSHDLNSTELIAYITKTLQKLILNTNKNSYNKKHNLYPKGTQKISKDEKELLNFQFNRRETTQYNNSETTPTENINIIGTITIPDTLTRTLRAVRNAIIHLNEETDTTDASGKYIFTNVTKGTKNLTIDSTMTDGKSDFHQYEEEGINTNNDQEINKTMFPKINLIYNFVEINTILDLWKYNSFANEYPDRIYYKPNYSMQINID